jgi:4-aminobutyrate aminotransferase-like enzyme
VTRERELARLQHRHRLEALAERFGHAVAEADVDHGHIRFAALSRVRVDARPLDAARARAHAEKAGLDCDADGIRLPWGPDVDVEPVEEALQRFFSHLLESDPEAFLVRPARGRRLPASMQLPESAAWLERFYGGDFLPREKKPVVVDLARSGGAYLRSVDRDPLQILDAASQIASLPQGFRAGPVQAALDEGRFDPHLVAAIDVRDPSACEEVALYTRELLAVAPPGIQYVSFTNGGAEANEKALHLARLNGPGGRRVLAFEGAFHGRTLLTLSATWNKEKRGPYQIAGYEAAFAPFPVAQTYVDPAAPPGWRAAWYRRDGRRSGFGEDRDPLLAAEVASLRTAEDVLREGDVFACIVEPFQCEGGDRPATPRFFQALRGLTRAYGVPLILDEVQTGFGLSGPLFWHQRFWLLDENGRPDSADAITCAKRAQVGVVLSRWPDPVPGHAHGAGIVRGRVHLDLVHPPLDHSGRVKERLQELHAHWPAEVLRPRAWGDAIAFDVPDRAIAQHLLDQRFHRGYMVYLAGERTLRYRLHREWTEADIDLLFDIIEESLSALADRAGGVGDEGLVERMKAVPPGGWTPTRIRPPRALPTLTLEALLAEPTPGEADQVLRRHGQLSNADRAAGCELLGLPPNVRGTAALPALRAADPLAFEAAVGVPLVRFAADVFGTRVRRVSLAEFDRITHATEALEADAYEPARRDTLGYLRSVAAGDGGIFLVAEEPNPTGGDEILVGIAAAGPLERWWMLDGPRQDPNRGRENTLYSADITVSRNARARGVGYRLRVQQLREALAERWPDGTPRYAFITGRNRVGKAEAMWELNQKVGAYTVAIYAKQYGEADGLARYYRIPLRRHDRRPFDEPRPESTLDASGVFLPTGLDHPLLRRARALGTFDEPAITKLTVSNFITRPYARYGELLKALAPRGCRHLYLTSSADEMVDKTLRVLKHRRSAAQLAVALEGGYAGTITAAARSLTDPRLVGGAHFDWPFVPHPGDEPDRTLAALDALVAKHGAEGLLGVFVESVQAFTGAVLGDAAWAALCAWRDRTGVPLVLVETTTGTWRSGRGKWWLDGLASGDPDVVLWWAGGQTGHVFMGDRTFVDRPLTFISTWDGDELSAVRLEWQLYACATAPVAERAAQLDRGLRAAGFEAAGLGLYRVLRVGERAGALADALKAEGIRLGRAPDALIVSPPVTVDPATLDRLCERLAARTREAN